MIQNNPTKLNNLVTNYNLSPVVLKNVTHTVKGDSGATSHYLSPIAKNTLTNITPNHNVIVTIPDNSK